jgi:hypothetical protein
VRNYFRYYWAKLDFLSNETNQPVLYPQYFAQESSQDVEDFIVYAQESSTATTWHVSGTNLGPKWLELDKRRVMRLTSYIVWNQALLNYFMLGQTPRPSGFNSITELRG